MRGRNLSASLFATLGASGIPAEFSSYIFPQSDIEILSKSYKPFSESECWLVKRKSTGQKYIFKVFDTENGTDDKFSQYVSLIISVMSLRFYFISPAQGFSVEAPYGLFYNYYEDVKRLDAAQKDLSGTHKTIIAALISYALAFLSNSQVVHGSLHAGNILLTSNNVPILTDTGLGKIYSLAKKEAEMGTLSWVAPELVLNARPNYQIDNYSYGVLLYELFEGILPYSDTTNAELYVRIKNNCLKPFSFNKTPNPAQKVISSLCKINPDGRMSMAEVYQMFVMNEIHFPGADLDIVRKVLAKYPIGKINTPLRDPPRTATESINPMTILKNIEHPRFDEYIDFLRMTMTPKQLHSLCNFIKSTPGIDPRITKRLLQIITESCLSGRDFLEQMLDSGLFNHIDVSDDMAGSVFRLMAEVLTKQFDLFNNKMDRIVAISLLYRPEQTVNCMGHWLTHVNLDNTIVARNFAFFIEQANLLAHLPLAAKVMDIINWVYDESSTIRTMTNKQVLGFVRQCSESADVHTVTSCLHVIFNYFPGELTDNLLYMAVASDFHWESSKGILLSLEALPIAVKALPAMIQRAREPRAKLGLALLMKYVGMSKEHARTLAENGTWMAMDLPDTTSTYELFLMIFLDADLRKIIIEDANCPVLLGKLILRGNEFFNGVFSIIMRIPVETSMAIFTRNATHCGFFKLLSERLSTQEEVQFCTTILIYTGRHYSEDYDDAIDKLVKVFARYSSDEMTSSMFIRMFSILSNHRSCMERMSPLVDDIRRILAQKPDVVGAKKFLKNAAKYLGMS